MKSLVLLALVCLIGCEAPDQSKVLQLKTRELHLEGVGGKEFVLQVWRTVDPETGATIYVTRNGGISTYPSR